MNAITPQHAFASPAKLAALRADIAARRKARSVNLSIHARQHGAALLSLARFRLDRSAQVALGRLTAAGGAEDHWTPAISRDLRAVVRGLTAAVARCTAASVAGALAWHLDRLRELSAQDARIGALEAVLEAHWPEGMKTIRQRVAAKGKR